MFHQCKNLFSLGFSIILVAFGTGCSGLFTEPREILSRLCGRAHGSLCFGQQ